MLNRRTEEHEIKLTFLEMDERGREAIALVATLKDLADQVKARKKRLAELGEIHRTGKERRAVEVYDRENTPALEVDTVRLETGEVLATRKMRDDEVHDLQAKVPGTETPKSRQLDLVPGGGASSTKGPTAEEIHDKLAADIRRLCEKTPRDEAWLLTKLEKGCPEASPEERKRAVTLQVETKRLVEQPDGKLLWVGQAPAASADQAPVTH